jgi:excisionase family DNA binding protein
MGVVNSMQKANETEEIGVAEASRRLGITMDHLYSLLWAAKLKARKVDGKWRIPVAAIQERITQRGES